MSFHYLYKKAIPPAWRDRFAVSNCFNTYACDFMPSAAWERIRPRMDRTNTRRPKMGRQIKMDAAKTASITLLFIPLLVLAAAQEKVASARGGARTVIHFCISKTEHCIRTPHVSVIFDGVIVARKYPFVKTARLIKYAACRKEPLSYCTIPIPKARHMAQSPSREAARNTACKCLQHLIECG